MAAISMSTTSNPCPTQNVRNATTSNAAAEIVVSRLQSARRAAGLWQRTTVLSTGARLRRYQNGY
jgi:hypothetical protein